MKWNPRTLFNKCFWLHLCGLLFVALGFIGMALPVMPTTVFFILALACFSKSSPKFEQWLLEHPKIGPSLKNWNMYRVIPLKGKLAATFGMSLGLLFLFFYDIELWIIAMIAAFELLILYYIYSKPSAPPIQPK